MKYGIRIILITAVLLLGSGVLMAQADDICREFGLRPSSDEPIGKIPYIYGRIAIKGYDPVGKFPQVTVNFLDPLQTQRRLTVDKTGNYCFRRSTNGGGTLVVEVEGVETVRKSVSSIGPVQTREDFEVVVSSASSLAPPGVISTKYSRPRNENTVELYQKAAEAERGKDIPSAIRHLRAIVAIDKEDFIALTKLGSLQVGANLRSDAERSFTTALELKPDYPAALFNFGMLRAFQNQFEMAIDLFKRAIASDPESPQTHRMLGEAYLQVRKGSLAIESLNEALRLEPVGQADCHLLIARLYDLVGAKNLASAQYKAFLAKVPNHPERKTFETYIADNPIQ